MTTTNSWWQWRSEQGPATHGFAVIGAGRFGSSVIDELIRSGADVLAVDIDQRAIDQHGITPIRWTGVRAPRVRV